MSNVQGKADKTGLLKLKPELQQVQSMHSLLKLPNLNVDYHEDVAQHFHNIVVDRIKYKTPRCRKSNNLYFLKTSHRI